MFVLHVCSQKALYLDEGFGWFLCFVVFLDKMRKNNLTGVLFFLEGLSPQQGNNN